MEQEPHLKVKSEVIFENIKQKMFTSQVKELNKPH